MGPGLGLTPAFLACAPSALVLADARSLAFLAFAPFALVLAHAFHSLFFFLALGCPLPYCSLTNRCPHAGRFQMARLHQATRERWQRRLQLLPRSMHRVTTAAHVQDPRLLLALSLHRSITTVWPCSFQRRYGPLARCTLPLPHLHQDQGLCSVLLRQRVLKS